MALWLVRSGRYGEYEQRFFVDHCVYACWAHMKHNLSKLTQKKKMFDFLSTEFPNASAGRTRNYTAQLWSFVHEMKVGDWVLVPYKTKRAMNVAEIVGPYAFEPNASPPLYHSRPVKWIERDIPRSNFDQDLLYSFGAVMSICKIKRNDAERRIRAMAERGWRLPELPRLTIQKGGEDDEPELEIGAAALEQLARDQIANGIIRKFKGHGLARLVEAILKAQGYQTYLSPEGPDKGVDVLAAPEPLGFGTPRLCVQVKSGETPVDAPTLNGLIGAMQNVNADQGLLVSWGGFRSSVEREVPAQFFRVRLWDQDTLIDELLSCYDRLDPDLRAELPLKRLWTLSGDDETEPGVS